MRKIKKTITILIIFLLIFGPIGPRVVLAEETGGEEPPGETEQTEETTEVEIENQAEVNNEVDSTAITGESTIEEPTPTPTVDPVSSEETLETEGLETGGEILAEVSPTPTPSPAEINTGDAVSVVEMENSVNTTEVNSQTIYHTLNIFVPQGSDIDLSTTPLAVADTIFNQDNNFEPVVNVAVFSNQNFAYLSNDIVSLATSGNNSINGADEAIINTGDAYSVVTLLNKVNTTIVDSTIHVVTINIFGGVDSNIFLPEFSSQSGEGCCSEVIEINNQVSLTNEVDSTANSGQNSITGGGEASIETGDAVSTVNLINIVNTNLIGVNFYYLYINTFGTWTGNFLGWDDFGALEGGGSLALNSVNSNGGGSCSGCYDDVSVENQAIVSNHVSSSANTGGNSIEGDNATIKTGNAYSTVSIINFINSSIIKSLGFFGFINIFGFLDGDIGGASLFAAESPSEPELEPEGVEKTSEPEAGPLVREEGGQLEVYQATNIGTHVLPGDTITFFVTVKNPGTGRVYEPVLKINFIKDGVDMGGAAFDLDDIEAGKGIKITTGLVLSEEAKPGDYVARAVATGYVGPDNNLISAYAESPFIIGGGSLSLISGVTEEAQAAGSGGEMLGAMTTKGLATQQRLLLMLLSSLIVFLMTRAIREKEKLAIIWSHRRDFLGAKVAGLHSIVMKLSSFLS